MFHGGTTPGSARTLCIGSQTLWPSLSYLLTPLHLHCAQDRGQCQFSSGDCLVLRLGEVGEMDSLITWRRDRLLLHHSMARARVCLSISLCIMLCSSTISLNTIIAHELVVLNCTFLRNLVRLSAAFSRS